MKELYCITSGDLYGFMDELGSIIIEPKFSELIATYFSDGLCPFVEKNKCGFFDQAGNIKIPAIYDSALPFSNKMAAVMSNGKWGYIDTNGNLAIPLSFDDACGFDEYGIATVEKEDKWGYIDIEGNFIIPPTYDEAYDFNGELAKVEIDGQFGYINRKGKLIWSEW